MNIIKIISVAVLVMLGAAGLSCAVTNDLKDGKYRGEYSFVTVEIVVEGGKMTDIRILHHGGGGPKYAAMVEPLLSEMVAGQDTEVDVITGATVSSKNLKRAVDDAIEKAR